MTDETNSKRWWLSWWGKAGVFELHSPWWISGSKDNADDSESWSFCAAVIAPDEDAAMQIVLDAHDPGHTPEEWRFVNERAADWTPFCERFGRVAWMRWPE